MVAIIDAINWQYGERTEYSSDVVAWAALINIIFYLAVALKLWEASEDE